MIEPDTILEVILEPRQIPDGACVRKVTGEKEYTLKHKLKVYFDQTAGIEPFEVDGYFLVSDRVRFLPTRRSFG